MCKLGTWLLCLNIVSLFYVCSCPWVYCNPARSVVSYYLFCDTHNHRIAPFETEQGSNMAEMEEDVDKLW